MQDFPTPNLPIEIGSPEGGHITGFPIVLNYFFNVPQDIFTRASSPSFDIILNIPEPNQSSWFVNQNQVPGDEDAYHKEALHYNIQISGK